MAFRLRVALVLSAASFLVLLVPGRSLARTVRVDCGATRDIGSIAPAKQVVFKIANLGSCCAQVILYDSPDQAGNVLLDVTLCPNERLNVDRPDSLAASARLIGGAGSGQAILDFVALPQDDDVNWARHGEHIASTNVGNVGIGTTSPGEKLTVCGIIESKSGGVKFPDGTVQSTAAAGTGLYATGAADFSATSSARQLITGLGFQSVRLRISATYDSSTDSGALRALPSSSIGTAHEAAQQCVWFAPSAASGGGDGNQAGTRVGDLAFLPLLGGSSELRAVTGRLLSLDSDGFTLEWSHPSVGTTFEVHLVWEAYR